MAFVVKKRFSLDFLGEDWKDAYIDFNLPSLKESLDQNLPSEDQIKEDPKKYTLQMVDFLEQHFVDGQGWDDSGKLVQLKKEDISELPQSVFGKAFIFLSGDIDPNS